MTEDYRHRTRERYRDESVAAQYHREMTGWRNPVDRFVARQERRAVRAAMKTLGVRQSRRVLDIPAGTGKLVPVVRPYADHYVAADISDAMMSFIEADVAKVVADATRLPFADHSFDLVCCVRLLHRVPEEVCRAVLGEIARLAPIAVVTFAGPPRHPRLRGLFRRLTRRGEESWYAPGPDGVAAMLAPHGGRIESVRNIASAVSVEYVAAVRFGS